ncbi:MAG: D-alanyl-D-alanine carboxypeptidase [Firmicutes bacterium]|nr:D-alanyl-D-alanine carboxypeptidase [Bacillota bacterium]
MKERIFRHFIIFALTAALILMGAAPSFAEEKTFEGAGTPPETEAEAVIVMDAGSGTVLYEKDAYAKRDPASITKILNCLVCLENLDFSQTVTVDYQPTTEGSSMKLKEGETLVIRDIVYGMMLWSGNDAAEYLGYLAGGGDMYHFCEMMNAKARDLGALDTAYVNPNGLNNMEVNNVTTAYDIAVVVKSAMKNDQFREIVGTQKYRIPATNLSEERKVTNSNFCLWDDVAYQAAGGDEAALDQFIEEHQKRAFNFVSEDEAEIREAARENAQKAAELMYKPCIGVKTGYSSTAGDCFAGFAQQEDTEIIVVVLGEPHSNQKFRDAKKLWEYAYDNFKTYTAQAKEDFELEMDIKHGELREVAVGLREDFKVTVLKDENPSESVTTEIVLNEEKPEAPIEEGAVVGQLVAYDNGKEIARRDLVSLETSGEGGPLSYIGFADEDRYQFFVLLAAFLLILFLIIFRIATRKKRKAKKMARKRARQKAKQKKARH